MNTYPSSHSLEASRRGVALVIVLSMLVLMSAVLVAFMGSVSSERAAQRAAYSGFEAQQAAESAVNLVISQIRSATQNDDGTMGWASQPGAIRTFGGSRGMVFKLYSSDNMQEPEESYAPNTFEESGYNPDQPKETTPAFADLNSPVLTPGADKDTVDPHYPIMDPRAGLTKTGDFAGPGKGRVEGFWTPQQNFHVSGKKDSNGIRIMEAPMRVRWLYQLKDGTMVAPNRETSEIPGADKDNPPVARVAFWTDDETAKLNLNTAGENTYWDSPMASVKDESGEAGSAKLTYSVMPGTNPNRPPAGLGASQPTAGEYQRYPGHPATTNLSPALRWLFKPAPTNNFNDWEFKEALYRLLPRIRGGEGSSMGGTRANDDRDLKTVDYRLPKRDRLFSSVDEFWFRPDRSPISNPGYFGVFRREGQALMPDWDTVQDLPQLTPQTLEQLRFFLTAHSRSPDLNAFGHPRVSIWPVHQVDNAVPSQSRRTGYDDLMAFCASVSKKSYYFTRFDPWSTTWDLTKSGTEAVNPLPSQPQRNRKLLFKMSNTEPEGYLQRMGRKNIPGVGASFAQKYSDVNPLDATRTFTEYERILLSIFDYIRTTNLIDTGRKGGTTEAFKFAYTPGYSNVNNPTKPEDRYNRGTKANVGSGQVVPSVVYQNNEPVMKGFGRFVNLAEVGLVFCRDDRLDSSTKLPFDEDIPQHWIDQNWEPGVHFMGIRCIMLPEMFTVSPGYTALAEGYAFRAKELLPFMVSSPQSSPVWGDKTLNIANQDFCMVNVNPWRIPDGRFFMPTRGFNNLFFYETTSGAGLRKILSKPNINGDASSYSKYPFYSKRFFVTQPPITPGDKSKDLKAGPPVAPLPQTFLFHGGKFEFEFFPLEVLPGTAVADNSPAFQARANTNQLLQRIRVQFPAAKLKVPDRNRPIPESLPFQERIATNTNGNWYLGTATKPNDLYLSRPAGWGQGLVRPTDVVRSMEFSNVKVKGDYRFLAGLTDVPEELFEPAGSSNQIWTGEGMADNLIHLQVHNFRNSWGRNWPNAEDGSGARYGLLTPSASYRNQPAPKANTPVTLGSKYDPNGTQPEKLAKIPLRNSYNGNGLAVLNDGAIGDFDRAIGKNTDGPFINKADEGNARFKLPTETDGGHLPYFRGGNGYEEVGETYFSPNRLMPSAVMFGSLPTGLFSVFAADPNQARPWQTLQFCPSTTPLHKGSQKPADHYLLDLFHMPVVEPYAISEPLSTAGRVNLNALLAPFGYVEVDGRSYIQRNTGLYGVIKGMKQFAINNTPQDAGHREGPLNDKTTLTRFPIDVELMMENGFKDYLKKNKYFKYASEICELDLPIKAPNVSPNINESSRKTLWQTYNMTGDNARERPYAHIYPRLTTKSNVYTVHVWAQSIAKNPATKKDDWKKFDESKDRILGEYRGSTTIERFIDANDPALLNYDIVENPNERGLDPYYRFRIVNQKRFAPQ